MGMETDVIDDIEAARQELADINAFVKERYQPTEDRVNLLGEEVERIALVITGIQEGDRERRRRSLFDASEDERLVVTEGPYAGMDVVDLAFVRGFAASQLKEEYGPGWHAKAIEATRNLGGQINDELVTRTGRALEQRAAKGYLDVRQFDQHAGRILKNVTSRARAALDSTTATAGDELVSTLEGRELWMDVNLQTQVSAFIPTIPMPSEPFEIPTQIGDINFYPGTQNVVAASSAPTTARVTLNSYEIVGMVPFSFTLEEDAIIAMLPEIRAGIVRNVAEVLDDLVLNADTSTTTNINGDGATLAKTDAGKGHWLYGADGLIHLPLVDNTSQSNNHNAAVSDDMFNEIRAKLGKYGVRPSQLVWVMDVNTFIRAQSINNFRTMDKLGPNATLLNGMLGAVEGIPVVVSEQMKLADTDGKVTDAGNGTDTGRLLIVNRSQWFQGFRREMTIDIDRDVQKRQTIVVVSFRHGLLERSGTRSSATHTALQYDITGV
jgi:hypothetical protein